HQLPLPLPPRTLRTLPPGVVPAARDLQHFAQNRHRPFALVRLQERVSQFFSFAKNAVAFFKMSRSIRSRRFSSRRRASSWASVSFRSFVGIAFSSGEYLCRQFRNRFSWIPRLRAAWAFVYPPSVTSFTASRLNSSLCRLCFLISRLLSRAVYALIGAPTILGEVQGDQRVWRPVLIVKLGVRAEHCIGVQLGDDDEREAQHDQCCVGIVAGYPLACTAIGFPFPFVVHCSH